MLHTKTFSPSWISNHTWCCLITIVNNFLSHGNIDIFTDTDPTPLTTSVMKSYYVSDFTKQCIPMRDVFTDTIIISKNLPNIEISKHRNRTVLVTLDRKGASSLWTRHKLLNSVVLINESAYTWFPYKRNQCEYLPTLQFLDRCSKTCKLNKQLYPNKLPSDFNGCTLFYGTSLLKPNSFLNKNGTIYGREPSMMNTLAMSLGFSVNTTVMELQKFYPEFLSESRIPSGSVHRMLIGDFDFIYGPSPLHILFLKFADPLPVVRKEPIYRIFPSGAKKSRYNSIYSGFSTSIWIFILTTLILSGITLYFMSLFNDIPWYWLNIVSCFVVSPVTKIISLRNFRIFFVIYYFYCLHIAWFYQATLLKNLYKQPFEKQISSFEEAFNAGLAMEATNTYVQNLPFPDGDKLSYFTGIFRHRFLSIEGPIRLDQTSRVKQKTSFLTLMAADLYELRENYTDAYLTEDLYIVPDKNVFMYLTPYGVSNSPLTEIFSVQILHLLEGGLLLHLRDLDAKLRPLVFKRKFSGDHKKLDVNMLQSAYFLYLAMICFSIVVFLFEYYGKDIIMIRRFLL